MPIAFTQVKDELADLESYIQERKNFLDMLIITALHVRFDMMLDKEHDFHQTHDCLGPESETVFLELKEFVYGVKPSPTEGA